MPNRIRIHFLQLLEDVALPPFPQVRRAHEICSGPNADTGMRTEKVFQKQNAASIRVGAVNLLDTLRPLDRHFVRAVVFTLGCWYALSRGKQKSTAPGPARKMSVDRKSPGVSIRLIDPNSDLTTLDGGREFS